MLARYTIYRGKRPPSDPQPGGIRQDSRWRTSHPLRPTEEMVKSYLADPNESAWHKFRDAYVDLLERRFQEDRVPFDRLAKLATDDDLFIGCSCPTKANPRVDRCHTYLALGFMRSKYQKLRVKLPRISA